MTCALDVMLVPEIALTSLVLLAPGTLELACHQVFPHKHLQHSSPPSGYLMLEFLVC